MPDDIFNGSETVHAFVELPANVYTGLSEAYDSGIRNSTLRLSMDQYLGGFICEGIQAILVKQNTPGVARAFERVETLDKSYMMSVIQSQMSVAERKITDALMTDNDEERIKQEGAIEALRETLNKVSAYGRF